MLVRILIVMLCVCSVALAQPQKLELTLDKCIEKAQDNSPQAKIIKSAYLSSLARYRAFKAGYLPQLNFSGAAPGLNRSINPITLEDGTETFRPQSNLFSYGDLNLSQKIPFTGGTFSVSSGLSRLDIQGTTDYTLWRATPFRITFNQPIFQVNNMKWDRQIEKLEFKKNQQKYYEDMESIAIEATRKFFDLYIAQMNVENAKFNVAINDTLYQLSLGRYKVGKIAENDLLQSELALLNTRNNLESQQLALERTREELQILLGIEGDFEIVVMPPDNIPVIEIIPDDAIEEALARRSDVMDFELQKLRASRAIESARSNNRFTANLSASFGVNQSAGVVEEAYEELLNQETFNLTFQVPLFQWGKGPAEVEEAVESSKSTFTSVEQQEKNLKLDVKYQALSFMQLQNQAVVSAKADTVARRRFVVAKNRYMIGKIDLNTFFIAQNEKDNALRSYIQTMKNYWVSYYNLRRLTLFDYSRGQPVFYDID